MQTGYPTNPFPELVLFTRTDDFKVTYKEARRFLVWNDLVEDMECYVILN